MDTNQILMIIIVVLIGIIVVFGVYFLIVYMHNKKHEKKMDTIFDPNNLVEEESLMNVMDQKKNIEFTEEKQEEKRTFLNDVGSVDVVTSGVKSQEQKINPFGVDMTMRTKDNTKITTKEDNPNQNKFIN